MSGASGDEVRVLRLSLHNRLVGYLAGYRDGRNVFHFADEYRIDPARPTLGIVTHPRFPRAERLMAEPWITRQRLHPVLSNLLPEGALREWIAQSLKVHVDNEFHILSHLGRDLPGALIAEPLAPEDVPAHLLARHGKVRVVPIEYASRTDRFSLAGIQMKLSMTATKGRYTLAEEGALGEWIVKPPSTRHPGLPANEYTAMTLASLIGVDIPDIQLVEMGKLDWTAPIALPDEPVAYVIRRFDRASGARVHMEDFAQVLVKYPHEKYGAGNYEQIGRILYEYAGDGLADVQQLARRLLANILLGNGDAHLKNWSLVYPDRFTPRLAPAYDIVTTLAYIQNEQQFALNLGGTKDWYGVGYGHFERWATKTGVPWRAVKAHLDDAMERARGLWPQALTQLPMHTSHKTLLLQHWARLQPELRIQ